MTLLEQAYEYRRLLSRCHSDAGLEMAEIQELAAAEARLLATLAETPRIDLVANVRGGKADDRVRVVGIGPASLSLAACPYLDAGSIVEVAIEDATRALSYRFKAAVLSLTEDDGDQYTAVLELVGAPVLLRRRLRTNEHITAEAA